MSDDQLSAVSQLIAVELCADLLFLAQQNIREAIKSGAIDTETQGPKRLARICLVLAAERLNSQLDSKDNRVLANLRRFI